jgi:ribonuclease R
MQQASYDAVNVGHYGLASSAYLHFTSPIRRYPDLIVHRLIRAALRKRRPAADMDAKLREMALESSRRERNAMEAEREVADLYRALYMRSHIGERFEGTVTAITPNTVYLRLAHPFVDVQVPLEALGPDGYEVDESGLKAVGVRSGETITLGDSMAVLIEDVAIMRRSVLARRVLEPGARRADKKARKAERQQNARAARMGRRKTGRGRGRR